MYSPYYECYFSNTVFASKKGVLPFYGDRGTPHFHDMYCRNPPSIPQLVELRPQIPLGCVWHQVRHTECFVLINDLSGKRETRSGLGFRTETRFEGRSSAERGSDSGGD